MSPETQNWWTIASDTMPGEMYRLVAFFAMAPMSAAGPTR
jgi:hypothetical protein